MANRVVTPVNLKERIALLQQKASGSSPSSYASTASPASASSSSVSPSSSSASTLAGSSGSALRERIAKFEQKGGVPVPRGSFGLGAPPPPLEQTHEGSAARKKGELYGNRIASVSRATGGQMSPPSTLRRHLTGNADVSAASSRSLVPSASTGSDVGLGLDELSLGDGSPMRKRCVSTSSLTTKRPVSTAVFPPNDSIMSGSFDEGGSADDISLPVTQLFIPNNLETQAQLQIARCSSISSADAMRLCISDSSSNEALSSLADAKDDSITQLEISEEGKTEVPESVSVPSSVDDHNHVGSEGHQQKNGSEQRTDNVALTPAVEDAKISPSELAEGKAEREEIEDESSVKTPVVATFSPSATKVPLAKEVPTSPSHSLDILTEDLALSDVETPGTDSSSPLRASLEFGERVYCEQRRCIVIPPRDTTIAEVLEQPEVTGEDVVMTKDSQEDVKPEIEIVSALGISGTIESRGSTETVSANRNSLPAEVTEKNPLTPQSTGSSSMRRRHPPAPLIIQHEKEYSEPSLDPKVGPKSFHAIVHGKTTQAVRAGSSDSPPRTTVPRAPVAVVRSQDSVPETPGSPDLSALVAQAMCLEQRLVSGEGDVNTPREDKFQRPPKPDIKVDTETTSRQSNIVFPSYSNVDETRDTAPALPLKDLSSRTLPQAANSAGPGSRKSWSRSSGNASSEDSVPVLTPPSPTFDLAPSICEEPNQMPAVEVDASEKSENDETEGRRSISSVLSSPGRSARKKVLSMFSRGGRSSSTLALPDDLASDSTHSCESALGSSAGCVSVSIYASACPSSTLLPSPSYETTIIPQSRSPGLPTSLVIPRTKHDTPDVPRPVSVLSTTSAYSTIPSPLPVDLFDSFPDVPQSVPTSFEQDRSDEQGGAQLEGIELRLENARAAMEVMEEESPESPPPPTPPPKSLDLPPRLPPRIKLNPLPPPPPMPSPPYLQSQCPPPPSPPSKDEILTPSTPSTSCLSLSRSSLSRKSKSKTNLRLPHLPYLSSSHPQGHEREKSVSSSPSELHLPSPPSSFPHSSSSILGAITRSFSKRRVRSRKNSTASCVSISSEQ